MPLRGAVPAAVLAVILAGCDGAKRSFASLTAPSATVPAPASPAPSPPGPGLPGPAPPSPSGPPEDQPIPGSGPTYRPGVGTTTVASGETVHSIVVPTDPACFPNWDAQGRCKVFEITAPFDGSLMVAVRIASPVGGDNLDLFLVDPSRAYLISSTGINAEEASLAVSAGVTYGILVMAYTTPVPFELRVEVARR